MEINFSKEISVLAQINRAIFTAKKAGGFIHSIKLDQMEYLEFCVGMMDANQDDIEKNHPMEILNNVVYNGIPIINTGVLEEEEA